MILRSIAQSFDKKGDWFVGYRGRTGNGLAPNSEGIANMSAHLYFNMQSDVNELLECPVHLLETDTVDYWAGHYFQGGQLLLDL